MSENAEYFFCHFPLEYGIIGALDNANETSDDMARDGWMLDHVAMNGSFLLLVFWRPVDPLVEIVAGDRVDYFPHTPTPPHRTTDRGTPYDTPTTC